MASLTYEGRRISYAEYGSGDRVIVLIHGLLMNRRMFDRLAPELARRGNRVIAVDLLGHGESEQPTEVTNYSMTLFAAQVIALLEHLDVEQAVIGGTSLGANVTLEAAELAPERVRGMFIEMPVLENALIAAGAIFMPLGTALFVSRPLMRLLSRAARQIPRSHYLVDIALDWLRRNPDSSMAVLLGLFFGRVAPPTSVRRGFEQPALIIGHPADPLHPFSDSDMLARELPNARLVEAESIIEWRIQPRRLDDELAKFLDEVWAGSHPVDVATGNGHIQGDVAGAVEG